MSFRVKRGISRLKSYFVYILASKTGTMYAGVTDNIARSKYNIDRLVFYQEFNKPEEAIEMEKKIKGWTRQKKIDLIRELNPNVKDLAVNLI
ncbi:GIY-YIG nuclease family protein [Candidatus Daviesbacteria bacterium]|nr:GIY-YIG nuclease family protein [Candidatus Daviesbacteria bacterium]